MPLISTKPCSGFMAHLRRAARRRRDVGDVKLPQLVAVLDHRPLALVHRVVHHGLRSDPQELNRKNHYGSGGIVMVPK